jgi:hypothetical protein
MNTKFKKMPDELKTPKMCLKVVKKNGLALRFVPAAHQTEAVCLAAVQQNKDALHYVPEELKAIIQKLLPKAPSIQHTSCNPPNLA